jgi:phytoene synthase
MTLAYDTLVTPQGDALQKISHSSSFYTAMRVLPQQRRDGVMAIYAFCRIIDDIADDWRAPREPRLLALQSWRTRIDEIYRDAPLQDLEWLSQPIKTYNLARNDFHDVLDGMVMDAQNDIRAPSVTMLELYCDRVASAVGRLTTPIFGLPRQEAADLAHHLGLALQFTNILRDIDEDAAMGRIYLPRAMLAQAGLYHNMDPAMIAQTDLTLACEPLVQMARRHFMAAHTVMRARPRNETRAPLLMAGVYEQTLAGLMSRGFTQPRAPLRKSKLSFMMALLGSQFR